jgi:hypothetical protein
MGHALEQGAALQAMDGFVFIFAPTISAGFHNMLSAPNNHGECRRATEFRNAN